MLEEGPLNKSEISFNHYLIHKYKKKNKSLELWVTLYHITSALGLKIHVCVRTDGVLFLIPGLA